MSLRVTGARTMPPRVLIKMLYPSFGALSMDVAARLPVAPPLLIGAIGVFSIFDISSAKILPVTSAKPPGGKATTISIGREGYLSWDQDRVGVELRAIACSKTSTGSKIKHVPYKGGGEYIPALLGGHLDFVIGTAIATLPQESAGKLRTLALMGGNKMIGLPSVPTTFELGIKGNYLDSWAGAFVTAGTPKPVIDTLTSAAEKVIKSKEFGARIEKTGGVVQYIAPAEFRSMIERDKNTALEIAKKEGLAQAVK